MITFLVVGRNDGYGVNLPKRTAISLNYFASLCSDAEDEIIYVDCNSTDADLTLAESIGDTLTPEARSRLKIYRISGEQMRAAIGETPLPFSDELARNVGIRRSNPRNQWLLSTNCDVLVHPLARQPFTDLLRSLAPRFYLCPRIGIPPVQWQRLDRANLPQWQAFCDAVISSGVRQPPEKPQSWLRFAAVGDFQLAPRQQWFQIGGCEEGMKLWGHSDANNARRLNLLNGGGRTPDLGDSLCVVHLDHNLGAGNAHQNTLLNNDWDAWVEKVTAPQSRNTPNWGLEDTVLPLITLPVAEADPAAVIRAHRRQRNLLASWHLQLRAKFWKSASRVANWLDRRSANR